MNAWIYVLDTFKPIDVNVDTLLMLAEENSLKILKLIEDALIEVLGSIRDAKVYNIYFNRREF